MFISNYWVFEMINDNDVIEILDELEMFLCLVENGGLGFENVIGVVFVINNSDGCLFIVVFDDKY